jgi:hypothetical protein
MPSNRLAASTAAEIDEPGEQESQCRLRQDLLGSAASISVEAGFTYPRLSKFGASFVREYSFLRDPLQLGVAEVHWQRSC